MKWWSEVRYNWRYWLTPKYRYAVITALPKDQDGNCYDELLVWKPFCVGFGPEGDTIEDRLCMMEKYEPGAKYERAKLPVFQLGEILIVNRLGREVGGMERKPDKWFVECEYFYTQRNVVKRALEVKKKYYGD